MLHITFAAHDTGSRLRGGTVSAEHDVDTAYRKPGSPLSDATSRCVVRSLTRETVQLPATSYQLPARRKWTTGNRRPATGDGQRDESAAQWKVAQLQQIRCQLRQRTPHRAFQGDVTEEAVTLHLFDHFAAAPPKGDTYGLSIWVKSPQNTTFGVGADSGEDHLEGRQFEVLGLVDDMNSPVIDRPRRYVIAASSSASRSTSSSSARRAAPGPPPENNVQVVVDRCHPWCEFLVEILGEIAGAS